MDACDETRSKAWVALGLLDDPFLVGAVTRRLETSHTVTKLERLGMAHGLGATFSPAAKAPLRALTADPDAEVASTAKHALAGLEEMEKRVDQIKKKRAGGSSGKRSKMIRRLEKAARDGRIELGGEPDDLLTVLTPADIPLLNRARAAVSGRLSDECLYEYDPLTHAVRALRGSVGAAGEPARARD
jgi:hypothetical protein